MPSTRSTTAPLNAGDLERGFARAAAPWPYLFHRPSLGAAPVMEV